MRNMLIALGFWVIWTVVQAPAGPRHAVWLVREAVIGPSVVVPWHPSLNR